MHSLQALTSVFNTTTNATARTGLPSAASDLHTLISTVLSLAALSDWLKLFVVGGLFQWCRRYSFSFRDWVVDTLWITATFDAKDDSYREWLLPTRVSRSSSIPPEWILYWISRQPVWDRARMIEVSTRDFGMSRNSRGDDDDETCTKISYLPSLNNTHSIWYKGYYMTVAREEKNENAWSTKECLSLG